MMPEEIRTSLSLKKEEISYLATLIAGDLQSNTVDLHSNLDNGDMDAFYINVTEIRDKLSFLCKFAGEIEALSRDNA